jgi:two-component system response regulator FixJ
MGDEIYYHSFLNRGRLIHIVDADAATCEALSVLLRLEGFQTAFSLTADDFIVALERQRPDLIIINLLVGPDNGLALLRSVKMLRIGMPVLMLT